MRRRLEIARGLVHNPRIFFLDEPTTGLDPVSRVAVWEMLNRLRKSHALTMLITTHYMDEADRLCDRIAIVDHGNWWPSTLQWLLRQASREPTSSRWPLPQDSADWPARLKELAGVTSVESQGSPACTGCSAPMAR